MSTRVSIAYDDKYHVYSECFELDSAIYVELSGPEVEYEAYPQQITVRIPKNVVEAILDNADKIRSRLNNKLDWDME